MAAGVVVATLVMAETLTTAVTTHHLIVVQAAALVAAVTGSGQRALVAGHLEVNVQMALRRRELSRLLTVEVAALEIRGVFLGAAVLDTGRIMELVGMVTKESFGTTFPLPQVVTAKAVLIKPQLPRTVTP